jgi:hypothetical protein
MKRLSPVRQIVANELRDGANLIGIANVQGNLSLSDFEIESGQIGAELGGGFYEGYLRKIDPFGQAPSFRNAQKLIARFGVRRWHWKFSFIPEMISLRLSWRGEANALRGAA